MTKINELNASNAKILDAVRNDSSLSYQQRIPSATQGNVAEVVNSLHHYSMHMNEFIDKLVNRIGLEIFRGKTWTNPLAEFKGQEMPYGHVIEEMAAKLVGAKRFDPNNDYEDVFKREIPDVETSFHSVNRQDYYPLTISEDMLRRAFTSENGLSRMVNELMDIPNTSDQHDEYLIMKNLFAEYARNDGFYKVNVPDPDAVTTQEERLNTSLEISEKIRAYASRMKFLSTSYNPAGVPSFNTADDLVLFATPELVARLDVNVLAFALKTSAAEVPTRIVEIDDFGIDGCVGILASRDFFVVHDTLFKTTNIENPKALSWNYFLHHHGIYSVSRFVNAVMFTTEAGETDMPVTVSLSGVTIDAEKTTIDAGENLQLVATVAGTVDPAGAIDVPQGVVWSLTAPTPTANGTFLDMEGVLHTDERESNESVTVTAVTTYIDPHTPIAEQTAQKAEKLITIVPRPQDEPIDPEPEV